ncbi:MAG: hypothetical protein IPN74_20375 [Haliscomenobacter sp.]|nr:hypothetical protein [Haliscomenobacter sp.]MBK8880772.1 hypothetical protein [Haliscomenobacter sp.]
MKFRCVHNSIRLRVRKSDLDLLQEEGKVGDTVGFGGLHAFGFCLETGAFPRIQAVFEGGQIIVRVPKAQSEAWIHSEEVSLEQHQPLDNGETLEILVEKDFPCRHTTESNREDTFFELAPEDPTVC